MIGEYVEQNPDARRRRSATIFQFKLGDRQRVDRSTSRTARAASREGDGAAECTLELADADFLDMTQRQGRREKLFIDRQAQDQRQRDGVAEARVPEEDRSEQGDRGRREAARRRGGGGRGARPAAAAPKRGRRRAGAGDLRGARRSGSPRTRRSRRRSARSRAVRRSTDPDVDRTTFDARRRAIRARPTRTLTIADEDLAALAERQGRASALSSTASCASTATSPSRTGSASSRVSSEREGDMHMPRKVNVIGVGMIPVRQAGRERGVPRDGGEGRQGRARRREGRRTTRSQQAYAGYVYGD